MSESPVVNSERVLRWFAGALLKRYQHLFCATLRGDGTPNLLRAPYVWDGTNVFVLIEPAAAAALTESGAVAGLVTAADGTPVVQLRGTIASAPDQADNASVAAQFPSGRGAAPPGSRLYRITPAELQPRPDLIALHTASAGETIVKQGDLPDRFYVILAGACEVVQGGASNKQTVATLTSGTYFGETGLLAGVPRTASVVATGDTQLIGLSRAAFQTALAETAPTAEELARVIWDEAVGDRQ
ncbi:MAG: cyclic nucleotide-binding domain-containing protein [Thermomicrobiales bacterium]